MKRRRRAFMRLQDAHQHSVREVGFDLPGRHPDKARSVPGRQHERRGY
jgi:hypothetical protein